MRTEEQRRKTREYKKRWRRENPEKYLEERRRYRRKTSEKRAFDRMLYRRANGEPLAKERLAAWAAANPEKAKAAAKRRRQSDKGKRKQAIRSRKKHISTCKDQAALKRRIVANVDAAIPKNINAELRGELRAMLVEAVYAGKLPIRIKSEHAKEMMREHFRMFTKYGTVSLDAPRFDDSSRTLHDIISEGLWQ